MRNRGAVPAVLAVPSVPIEKDEVVVIAILSLFSNTNQSLH
jgi:hypothetical protein